MRRYSTLAVLALFAAATTAQAAPPVRKHAADHESAAVERLNEESLARARQGQSSPTPGPDTTSNLNTMSGQDAARGQNMQQPPMPFR
jgi:hypothetical protein